MFGTVRPQACALPPPDRAAYRQMYCGTCRGLGEYALAARALVSYDVVLLSAVIGGVQHADPGQSSCRCPLNPLVHKPIVSPEHPSMRAGAAVQLLLADAWLEDHAQDGLPAAGWLRPLLPVQRALDTLSELGFDSGPLLAVTARQREVEHAGADPSLAARPTAELVAHVLGSAVDLPGVEPALQTASARSALRRMGHALGEIIYLVDALDDLTKDAAKGAFNPCLDAKGRPDAGRVERAKDTLQRAVSTLKEGVAAFPWRRNQGLLEHVIQDQLPARVNQAMQAAMVPAVPQPSWVWKRLVAFAGEDPHRQKKRSHCGCCDACDCCVCLEGIECCSALEGVTCCECGSCCECGACCECGSCG